MKLFDRWVIQMLSEWLLPTTNLYSCRWIVAEHPSTFCNGNTGLLHIMYNKFSSWNQIEKKTKPNSRKYVPYRHNNVDEHNLFCFSAINFCHIVHAGACQKHSSFVSMFVQKVVNINLSNYQRIAYKFRNQRYCGCKAGKVANKANERTFDAAICYWEQAQQKIY